MSKMKYTRLAPKFDNTCDQNGKENAIKYIYDEI